MNDPIINPWIIYLIDIVDNVQRLMVIGGAVGALAAFIRAAWAADDGVPVAPILRRWLWLPALAIVMGAMIPNRGAVVGMLVVQEITPARVEQLGEAASDLRDVIKADVLEIIDAMDATPPNKERGE